MINISYIFLRVFIHILQFSNLLLILKIPIFLNSLVINIFNKILSILIILNFSYNISLKTINNRYLIFKLINIHLFKYYDLIFFKLYITIFSP
jgi:hypothetical protein